MLSYRHAFHAGNHADVLKHTVLLALLDYLVKKETPVWVVDTHAGAGGYVLDGDFAQKTGEWQGGIGRLWSCAEMPEAVQRLKDAVAAVNTDGHLRFYAGSPWLVQNALRAQDKIRLFELHPTDFELLTQNVRDRRIKIAQENGFLALKSLLPPPSRRGLVLIDPPYEDKRDYRQLITSLQDALKRFATGVYAVWYPCLRRVESRQLPEHLKQLNVKSWLRAELHVSSAHGNALGMYGSGMFIVNPPWNLLATCQTVLPFFAEHLSLEGEGRFVLESHIP